MKGLTNFGAWLIVIVVAPLVFVAMIFHSFGYWMSNDR
jgi:hypothetical protein